METMLNGRCVKCKYNEAFLPLIRVAYRFLNSFVPSISSHHSIRQFNIAITAGTGWHWNWLRLWCGNWSDFTVYAINKIGEETYAFALFLL